MGKGLRPALVARDDEQLIELLLEHCEKLYSQGVAWRFSFPETDEPGGFIYDHIEPIRKLSQIKFNDSEFIFGDEVSEPYDNPTKRCYFCRKLLTSSNSFFCTDKHARQLYSRLMHERAIGLSDKIVWHVYPSKRRNWRKRAASYRNSISL